MNTGKGTKILKKKTATKKQNTKKTASDLGDFFLNLNKAKQKNKKETDQLANYDYGFEISQTVAKNLMHKNKNSVDVSPIDSDEEIETNESNASKSSHFFYIADGPRSRDSIKNRKKAATAISLEWATKSGPHSDESSFIPKSECEIGLDQIDGFDLNDDDEMNNGNDVYANLMNTSFFPVNTIDADGNEIFNLPWTTKLHSSTDALFKSKIFQVIAVTQDKKRCVVKCKCCPSDKKPMIITYGNNSNLIRHAKLVRIY